MVEQSRWRYFLKGQMGDKDPEWLFAAMNCNTDMLSEKCEFT